MAEAKSETATRYRAPALAKGLDILELLAGKSQPVSQTRIAAELDRSSSEVFRMLSCLVDRGYIHRSEGGEGFSLTMRLHQLAYNWPPSKRLVELALPEMRNLAEEVEQSCHLGMYNSGKLYVAAQAESPLPVALSVKVATDFPFLQTASGRVLLAWQTEQIADRWIAASEQKMRDDEIPGLKKRLKTIRKNGVEIARSDRVKGLTDISCPLFGQDGAAIAALTVPYLALLDTNLPIDQVSHCVRQSAHIISRKLGSLE